MSMNARLRIRCCATPPADAEAERLQYGGHGRFRGDVSQTALETTDQMLRHVEIGCFHRTAYPITWRDAVRGTMIVADDVCERHNDLLMRLERDLPIWDDSFEWRGPTPGIPLQMLGMAWEDSEYPDDLERFSVGSLVLAYLAGNHLSRDIRVFLEESQFPHELPDLPESKRFDFALFRRRCGRLQRLLPHRPDTWRYLPDAFSVVTMSTGNQLLDYDVGDRSQFDDWCWQHGWTRKAVRVLKRTYAKANRLLDALRVVEDWLSGDSTDWPQVFDLWLSCFTPPKPLQVRMISVQAFLDGSWVRPKQRGES